MLSEEVTVAVIGAGPYGLSLAAHLQALGISHRVFGEPMQTWRRRMPRGMMLKSDGFASNLYDPRGRFTLEAFIRSEGGHYHPTEWIVPLETFIAYGEWFQTQAVSHLDRREVVGLAAAPKGFALTLADGEQVTAQKVVLAVGIRDFSYVPREFSAVPPEFLLHSSEVPEPGALAGLDVTIVGGGASALDLAMLAHEAGASPRVVARDTDLVFFSTTQGERGWFERLRRPTSGLGPGWKSLFVSATPGLFALLPETERLRQVRRMLGPAAGRGVRERVVGKVPLHVGHVVRRIEVRGSALELTLEGEGRQTTVETQRIVAATGYRPDLARLGFLDASLAQRIAVSHGAPRLGLDFQSSAPGLYFIGLASVYRFGPVQRFAYGARYAAQTVARHLS